MKTHLGLAFAEWAIGFTGLAIGYVKIIDRLKDVIKSGGEWISSLQLEDLILKHPGVVEVAVIGVPDPKWIERPLALLVAKPGQEVSEAIIRSELQDFAAKGIIPRYSVPERMIFVILCPRPASGNSTRRYCGNGTANKG